MKIGSPTELIQSALRIAAYDLRWCYAERGIISGSRLSYWSWDSFFAGMGALRLEDKAIVKRNLRLYLSLQNQRGSLPKRIAHPFYWMRFIGIPVKETPDHQRPTFANSYFTAPSIAQNPIFILAFCDYVEYTGDIQFAQDHIEQLYLIMRYLEGWENKDGLLREGLGGGWAESVLKRGVICFTNVCYARSIFLLAGLCEKIGEQTQAVRFAEKYQRIKMSLNEVLWSDEDGGYYSDWLGRRRHHHFATDGNLLAIWWDIADKEKASKIEHKIDSLALDNDIPIRMAYAEYDFWHIYLFNRIGGMKDYHVGFSWTWLGCVEAIVKHKLGHTEEAKKILNKIAAIIVRDQTVHETYDHGKAVHKFFYKSEHPWAWGAGLFILACSELGYNLQEFKE